MKLSTKRGIYVKFGLRTSGRVLVVGGVDAVVEGTVKGAVERAVEGIVVVCELVVFVGGLV